MDNSRRDVVLLDARLPKCMVFDATGVNRWRWLQALLWLSVLGWTVPVSLGVGLVAKPMTRTSHRGWRRNSR